MRQGCFQGLRFGRAGATMRFELPIPAADRAKTSLHAVRQWLSARGERAHAVVTWCLVHMHFEWDEQKNQLNIKKHGINFETAVLCWEDLSSFDVWDEKHSTLEEER